MGNRAAITFSRTPGAPTLYLHWNGGEASVEAFLRAARDLSIRGGTSDAQQERAMRAMCTMIARHFFGVDLNVVNVYQCGYDGSPGDNGVYVIDAQMRIVDRWHGQKGRSQTAEFNPTKTASIYEEIMASAPIFND